MSLLLSVQGIEKYYADDPVLVSASLEIRGQQRVALIGPNGAGKTTLLKILKGELDPDQGTVELARGARMGFLEQRPTFAPGQTLWQVAQAALQTLVDLQSQADAITQQMSQSPDAETLRELTQRYDHLQAELTRRNAYQIDYKIEQVLQGLGFSKSDFEQPVANLSGGQVNRLMLASLLLEEPDLMLLDEPSNHLDIEATEWLENFLASTPQAFLLVSHDRYFLDRVCDQTLELLHGTIDAYPGNYSKYKILKEERLKVQQRTFEKQRTEIAKIEEFIRRNHYGQKATQAEDRRKKLDRIELVNLPRQIQQPAMRFPPTSRTGDIVLRCEGLAKAYAEPLFSNVSFQIERGQRWGILGPNGCGKSTLLKCIVGQQTLDQGKVVVGTGVKIGYFDQHLESVLGDAIAVEAVRPPQKEMVEQQRRDMLASFGITGDMAFQKVSSLSGGERNRVALARLSALEPNFMVFDEPTNHLDLWARDALEQALLEFDGTLLVVSHDRYFLNQICTHLMVFQTDRVEVFEGNYDQYRFHFQTWQAEQAALTAKKPKAVSKSNESGAANDGQRRKRKFPYRKPDAIEIEIANAESQYEQLQHTLADPAVLRSRERMVETQTQIAELSQKIAQLYEHWQEAMEMNT